MTTGLPQVLASFKAALEASGWPMRASPGSLPDQESRWEADHFALALEGPGRPAADYAAAGAEMREQLVVVKCFRSLAGDPIVEEPALLAEMEGLGRALEKWPLFPLGTDLVLAQECLIERDLAERTWGTGLLRVRVRYAVPYGSEATLPES